jgi:hypothetical protein
LAIVGAGYAMVSGQFEEGDRAGFVRVRVGLGAGVMVV